ncbi:MAG TPA: glycosyltransferase family 2 protein [Methanofastidiosum sp.]|nr:glycosyltransferase family 2 protein [Methanofastidiosum sp.]
MHDKYPPEISVIMPVYNTGQFLEESIESILNQTFNNFELIIVYDKSSDNSKEIIVRYMQSDERIILIENEIKSGIAAARNRGLEIARGKYIAVMDSDDISLPNRLEKEYLFLENNPEFFLVGSQGIMVDEKGNYLQLIKCEKDPASLIKDYFSFVHSSLMYRNKGFMYREKFILSDDYDFCLRLVSMKLKLINISDILVKYRFRRSGAMRSNINKVKVFDQKALEFYNQRLETGKDDYELFDEKEILEIPNIDSKDYYLKFVIRYLILNNNIIEAKKYFEEYKEMISFKNKILYKIALKVPFVFKVRFKIMI